MAVWKEYFEAAGHLRGKRDEWMMLENKRLEAERNLKEASEDKGGEEDKDQEDEEEEIKKNWKG